MKKICILCFLCVMVLCFGGCSSQSELKRVGKDLSCYSMEIEFDDETKSLMASESVLYVNDSEYVLDELCFHLYPNAFREGSKFSPVALSAMSKAYPNGKSFGKIDIKSVKMDGVDLIFSISGSDENILQVSLGKEIYPDESVSLSIVFNVIIPNCNHRFGYGENAVNIANFYPVACVLENGQFKKDPYSHNGDPFFSNLANYNVKLICDEKYVLASTGEVQMHNVLNDKVSYEIEAIAVRDFAFVLSEKFEIKTGTVGDCEVKYYYYEDSNPDLSLATSLKAVKTFSKLIGAYPYAVLSVVETNFVHGGMEYPNLVYISDTLTNYEDYTNVIVHEIAHQWWYGMVGNNAYSNSWLDEGLTEYTTALFYEQNKEYTQTKEKVIRSALNNYVLFVDVYTNVYGEVDTSMNRELCDFKSEPEYVYIAYVKGMLMFDSLRNVVGDTKFFKALKFYFDETKFTISTPEIMISCFESSTGYDLENFFSSWIDGRIVIMNFV